MSSQTDEDYIPEIPFADIEIAAGASIGEGSFGKVSRGTLRATGEEVAVKVLQSQDAVEIFRKEIAMMSGLKHPNVVRFHGICPDPGHLAIVTEFMAKGNLDVILKERDPSGEFKYPLSPKQRLQMALDAARGLAYLHNRFIIHRDVKSLNFLVNEHFTVKVCDFGLSVVKTRSRTMTGERGTVAFMAPELFRAARLQYTNAVDVYSFGIVLFEFVTRAEPYQFDDFSAVALPMQVCLRGARPSLPSEGVDMPLECVQLMQRCWHQVDTQRPTMNDVVLELERIVQNYA